jgi:hypothetical protein
MLEEIAMTSVCRWRPLMLTLAMAFGMAAQSQEDPNQTGPATLVIQYYCPPGQRAQLRQAAIGNLQRFEALKNNNLLAGYHILFSRYVNTNNWDMLAVLSFSTFADVAKWKEIERRTPAGLPAGALATTSAIFTYPADSVRSHASESAPVQPVYLVVPYTFPVARQAYLQYVDDYVRPQFEGWMREGVLARYEVLLQRYTASRPWDSLILLQYRDDESLGLRESVVAKIRRELQSNPSWKALSDSKQSVRVEKEAVVADELVPER